jgi:hypothetical protein
MRKIIVSMLFSLLLLTSVTQAGSTTYKGRGGVMGFIGGCCFGARAGAAYNDGKEIHWREWCRLIPYAGIVFAIWDGADCGGGKNTAQFADQYGAMYY